MTPPSPPGLRRRVVRFVGRIRGKLKFVAYVGDEILAKRLLTAVGLSPPEDEKPPPIRELVRAAIVRHAVSGCDHAANP